MSPQIAGFFQEKVSSERKIGYSKKKTGDFYEKYI